VKTAKEALDALDEFFVTADVSEARNLWCVLSALRGPDSVDGQRDNTLKDNTTGVIRAVAFPRLANLWEQGAIVVGATFTSHRRLDSISTYFSFYNHFLSHIRDAKQVLQQMHREPVVDENNKEAQLWHSLD